MNLTLIIICYSVLALVSLYFLIQHRLRFIAYSVVLLLTLCSLVGSLLKILHMPGGDQLLLAGFGGTLLGAILLIWRAFQNTQRQVLFYKLMAGACILLQIVIAFFLPAHSEKVGLLNYPVTAFLATIFINKQYEHEGERSIVIVFAFQGFLYILIEVLSLV